MGGLQGWHLVIIIVLAIVLFGAPKLPGMARSLGQSMRIFKSEVKQMKDENNNDRPAATDPVEGRLVDQQQPYNPVQDPARPQNNLPPQYRPDGSSSAGYSQGPTHQNGNPPANP